MLGPPAVEARLQRNRFHPLSAMPLSTSIFSNKVGVDFNQETGRIRPIDPPVVAVLQERLLELYRCINPTNSGELQRDTHLSLHDLPLRIIRIFAYVTKV